MVYGELRLWVEEKEGCVKLCQCELEEPQELNLAPDQPDREITLTTLANRRLSGHIFG